MGCGDWCINIFKCYSHSSVSGGYPSNMTMNSSHTLHEHEMVEFMKLRWYVTLFQFHYLLFVYHLIISSSSIAMSLNFCSSTVTQSWVAKTRSFQFQELFMNSSWSSPTERGVWVLLNVFGGKAFRTLQKLKKHPDISKNFLPLICVKTEARTKENSEK